MLGTDTALDLIQPEPPAHCAALQAKAKAEQAQIMMNNTSDSCSRQVAQTYKELRLVRQEAQLLQGQLQTALGQLEQKRKKKRLYKAVLLRETEQLQAALVHKDVRIGELNYRIDKVPHPCPAAPVQCAGCLHHHHHPDACL